MTRSEKGTWDARDHRSWKRLTSAAGEQMLNHLLPFQTRQDSLVGSITAWVRRAIIEGRLQPGDDLNSVSLSEQFSTSRTPVREALLLLEKEGLVEISPRRRPRVASIDISEAREIYRIRAALNALAMEHIATSVSQDRIDTLRPHFERMCAAADSRDVDAYFWANVALYEQIMEISGNRLLKRILGSLGLRVLQLRHLSMAQPGRLDQSCADHARLLRAFDQRDALLVAALGRSIVLDALGAIERSPWAASQLQLQKEEMVA